MKRQNILMVNPNASPKMPYDAAPLAILSAVSGVDRTVHHVEVIDWHYDHYEERLTEAAQRADICGITCMTGYQIQTMLEAATLVKRANPNILLVCGGCHPTLLPEQTLANDLIDCVVIGQGPVTFADLVDALSTGRDLLSVNGIGFKQNGTTVYTEPRPREDINHFNDIPYDLLENFDNYLVKTSFGEKTFYYLTSEGCPGNCKFCAEEALYHRRWRTLDIPRVIDDLTRLKEKYHFDAVAIADSNFYVSEKRTIEFCELMTKLNLKWGGTSGRPDQLVRYKDSTFTLMKESGVQDIFLGVESGSDITLEKMSKGCRVQQTLDLLPRLKKAGIRVQCSFIIGVPGVDIKEDFKSTMRLINQLRKSELVSQFHLFTYTPLPGTGFLPEAHDLGYEMPATLEGWTHYELHAAHTSPWIPAKYARFTDAASIYFMFLAGHARKVIEVIMPRRLLWLGLTAEYMMRQLSRFRIATSCFVFPVEYYVIKWVIMHKDRFFGDKKLMF